MADGTFALMQLAEANASGEAIGQVASFSGDVFIVRTDGTEVKGGQGTEIFQGDVVRTGDDGEVGLVFADDTTFSLGEDGEMTIDEMVYDAGSESGSASFSIAKGVFGFVSGQLAKVDPDAMVIDTPVATIGIRGSSGTGRAAPEGEESTFILVPDPDGTIGEIIIQTETGSVVMNVPYQASAVLSAFISPSAPVALPASVVARVFGNTVEALSAARANAGVQDGPAGDSADDSAAAAADEAPSGADAAEAEAEVSAADEAALEAAAASPDAEAEAAAAEAFDEALAGGGSLVDAFRAAVVASEQKGAEVARQAEEEEAESAELFGESIDRGLDNLLSQSRAAQEQGRSAAEAEDREQAGEQAQAAVEAGLTQDLNELAEVQARAQLESGFSRVLTEEQLAEIKAEKAAEAAAKATAAAAAAAAATAAAAAANTAPPEAVQLSGTTGADDLIGAAGDDIFTFGSGTAQAGDGVDGGAGSDILQTYGVNDFSDMDISGTETLRLLTKGPEVADATINQAQADNFSSVVFSSSDQVLNIKADGVFDTKAFMDKVVGFRGDDGHEVNIIMNDNGGVKVTADSRINEITFSNAVNTLKINSWDDGGVTLKNFGAGVDKIIINDALPLTAADNSASTSHVFQEVTTNTASTDLTTSGAASMFEFSHVGMAMAGANAGNAVEKALEVIGDGGTHAVQTTSDPAAPAKHIFTLYQGSGANADAGIFYYEDTNGDGQVNSGELRLVAWVEDVGYGNMGPNDIQFSSDPLIFDLDGDGVTLTGESGGAAFDVDADGVSEKTGWMDDGDAMLVIDENQNGVIDGMSEVVSSYLTYGGGKAAGKSSLDALAQFDDNADGVIDSADAVFSVLKLWKDADGDGKTDEGELLTLADFGITRIGLNGEDAGEETSGGRVRRTAEAEKANGDKVTVAEVSFDTGAEVQDDPTAGTSAA